MKRSNWLAAGVAATLVFACATDKEPAQQAVANLDNGLSAIHDSAAKYAPDTLQAVEAQVAKLKQDLAKGDYKAVLAGAPAAKTALASLRDDANTKQSAADAALAQTKQQWRNLNGEVPKLIADLKTQVDSLSQSRKLPKGVTKASFETVKTDVASLDAMWTDAGNTVANQDDYAGGVAKGQAVKDKATEIMHTLGMKPS
jgi:predicted  nucleic acid-binding Zn-ribbon protein